METGVWIVILAFLTLLALTAGWGLRTWRENSDADDGAAELWDLVEGVLDALERETQKKLQELPQNTVEAAAREVYRRFIAGTQLVNLITEQAFVAMVVNQWRKLAGLNMAVFQAVALIEAHDRSSYTT